MVGNMRKRNKGRKRQRSRRKPLKWLWEPFLNSLRKMPRGEKGWACYYCGKEGHLKQDCPQASKQPPAPCLVCKGPHWRKDCPQRCRFQGLEFQDNQDWRCPGVPIQAPGLITPEKPQVLMTVGGQSVDFLLDTGTNFSVLTEAPGPLSSWFTSAVGLSGRAKRYYFSCSLSCN